MCEFTVAVKTTAWKALLINTDLEVEEHFLVFSTQVIPIPELLTLLLLVHPGFRNEISPLWP